MSEETERPELEAVRRLLADARHDEPMPGDVAARMDRVLTGLSAERNEASGGAEVVSLEVHRRRRAAALLVAAAAIVVGGVTAVQHLPGDSGGQAAAGSATTEKDLAGAGSATTSAPATAPQVGPSPQGQATAPLKILAGRVRVRPGHFTADALSARVVARQAAAQGYESLDAARQGCVPNVTDGVVLRATYEKAPAALVYHAPAGSTQIVDLYVCGTAKPIRSITLPTP